MKLGDVMRMTARQLKRVIDNLEYKATNANNAAEHWKQKAAEYLRERDVDRAKLSAGDQRYDELHRETNRLREALDYATRALNTLVCRGRP